MTNSRNYVFHNGKSGAAITVHVVVRAAKDEIFGLLDDGTVKIRLKTTATKTDVNPVLIEFLAKILNVSTDQVEVVAGIDGSNKLVTVVGLEPKIVQERILRCFSQSGG